MAVDYYEDETGEEIGRALRSARAGPVRNALVGCRFYRDDPDDTVEIIAVPVEERVLVTRREDREHRLPFALFEQGYVIPSGPGLRAALDAARTPEDERLDQAAIILARHRIKPASLSIGDRLALAEAFEITDGDALPDKELRLRSYQLLRDHGFYRQAVPLLQRWSDLLPASGPEAVTTLIELAACYRHSGQIEHALGTTGRLAGQAGTMQPATKAVFACEHAAILMDIRGGGRYSLDRLIGREI